MKFVNDNDCDIDCMADGSNTTTSNGRMVMRIMTSVSQMAKFYGISTTKMMVQLLEMGYIKMLDSKEKGI